MIIAAALALIIFSNEAMAGGHAGKHHVHFKIHVPEIIKHHIHTKTVFVHLHNGKHGGGGGGEKKEVPKKKETHHEESHHEDWSTWSSYDHLHGGQHETKQNTGKYEHINSKGNGNYGSSTLYDPTHKYHHQSLIRPYGSPVLPIHGPRGSPLFDKPSEQLFGRVNQGHSGSIQGPFSPGQEMVGYSYPPQYSVHEEVDELPHNSVESKGYTGLLTQAGHVHLNELKNFYDDKQEEEEAEDYTENLYRNDYRGKYSDYFPSDNKQLENDDDRDNYKYDDNDEYIGKIGRSS